MSQLRQLTNRWFPTLSPRIGLGEASIIACLLSIALAMRVAFPSHMAIEHFDEGVYSSNLAAGASYNYEYPARHLYAPPLLPATIETGLGIASFISADPEWGAFVASWISGWLTVGLVWWATRAWFGPEAGLIAATFAALSDIHILYSRTALTDTLMCFGLLLSVYMIFNALSTNRLSWAMAAGIATGITWWTKYNGWLPLAIGIAGSIPWWLTSGRAKLSLSRYLAIMGTIVFTTIIVWSPVWTSLGEHGGYAAVHANHQKYVVGWSGWSMAMQRQAANQSALEGWPSILSLTSILLVPLFLTLKGQQCFTWNVGQAGGTKLNGKKIGLADNSNDLNDADTKSKSGTMASIRSLLRNQRAMATMTASATVMSWVLVIAAMAGTFFPLSLIAGISAIGLIIVRLTGRCYDDHRNLAGWLIAAWFFGLLLTTPLYRPYPRLMLPLTISIWIASAAGIAGYLKFRTPSVSQHSLSQGRQRIDRSLAFGSVILLVMVVIMVSGQPKRLEVPGWEARSRLRSISHEIQTDVAKRVADDFSLPVEKSVVYVFGEPALFFQLHNRGLLTGPIADFSFLDAPPLPVPTFVVIGPHARQTAGFDEMWKSAQSALRLVNTYHYQPSTLVQLNGDQPAILNPDANLSEEVIEVYLQK